MENLPILQDFVPYWGRCPKSAFECALHNPFVSLGELRNDLPIEAGRFEIFPRRKPFQTRYKTKTKIVNQITRQRVFLVLIILQVAQMFSIEV